VSRHHPNRYRAHPVDSIAGTITVPGDKSISHRALMLGAIAEGSSLIHGFLDGEDCLATRAALEALGVTVYKNALQPIRVDGVGLGGLRAPSRVLDLGNSGTGIRLMTGLLAGQAFDSELTGDASLRQRPMERVAAPLRTMGARIDTVDGKPPIRVHGGSTLTGIEYELPVASAQVKSALLLAGLYANGRTTVRSPGPSRDHTERMLTSMGVQLEQTTDGQAHTVSLVGPAQLRGREISVPADFSSAAFFIVAACIGAPDGLLIKNVGMNPTRTGLLTILREMGADIELEAERRLGAEPVADLFVRQSELRGIDVDPALVPLAIDEFPILFIAAAAARGTTRVTGAEELRKKETDRLAVMAQGLAAVGIAVDEQPDGLAVTGGRVRGGTVDSRGDHRVAMSFAIASLLARAPVEILNTAEVATSFPSFLEVATDVGLRVGPAGDPP
jgi:3-phosphoshikimate 1-carboxyvinyltransferase